MISAVGIRNLVENHVDFSKSRNLIIAAVILVSGLGFSNGLTFTVGSTSITLTSGSNGTNGTNGTDGVTPKFKIEDGNWFVSYDEGKTWTQLGSATGTSLFQDAFMDGDTLVLKDDRGNMLTVRLYGIDAPEGRQSMGSESRANMQRIAKGKRVRIKRLYVDNYQRTVAIVFLSNGKQVDDLSLNERQVQDGMAWVYDFFCKSQECNTWKFEEAMAKTRKIGIWKNPAPTPPWQWRAIQNSRP